MYQELTGYALLKAIRILSIHYNAEQITTGTPPDQFISVHNVLQFRVQIYKINCQNNIIT